jgi:hypothetical protein
LKKLLSALTIMPFLILLLCPFVASAQLVYPSPSYDYTPLTPRVGDPVTFNASVFLNHWTESAITALDWDFADGTTDHGALVTHVFTAPGDYWVGLTATDDRGYEGTCQMLVTVTDQTPVMVYLSLNSDRVYIGEDAVFSGNLTSNGAGVPDEVVSFATKVYLDDAPWVNIGEATTDANGQYTFNWHTQEPKGYQVRAMWNGNATYPPSSITRNLYVLSYGDLITAFQSNSTITNLNFNMTTRQLTFNAAGPDETSGYVNITLEKSPIVNPENLTVYLDDQPLQYTLESSEQSWNLYFTYHHSHHTVLVDFTGNSPENTGLGDAPSATEEKPAEFPSTIWAVVLAVVFLVVVLGVIVVYRKKNR